MAAIEVQHVSKRYRKGVAGYRTLREDLYSLTGRLVHLRRQRPKEADARHIWALRDVSFEIKQGERVGIIGRNGSGKTTLLRLLAGVTQPTEGKITVRGRLGVLIEIMAGFHPELTGRENIYLNGSIMGMSQKEIRRKFDEIVSFADIEQWIDTPIKRYSSGMHVRLGFAVAAHLDPDVLLVDEVLAVGDAAFQQKCLGKMNRAAGEGRTVLFVSHNMQSVLSLCPTSMLLDRGAMTLMGPSSEVIDSYLRLTRAQADGPISTFVEDPAKDFQLISARLLNEKGSPSQLFTCDQPVVIDLACRVRKTLPGLCGYLSITRGDGTQVMESDSHDTPPNPLARLPAGTYSARVLVPARTLAPGDYYVYLNFTSTAAAMTASVDSPGVVCSFRLDDTTSTRGNRRGGFFSTMLSWTVAPTEERSA